MKNFTKQNFKTNPLWIRLLIMTFMLLAGAGNVWAANEYGMQYLYVDCKSFTSYTQVNADMFWQVNCNEKAEYKSPFPTCPNDNNVFYVDLKSLNSSSYAYYRAFEISQGSGWWNKKCFSVPANNKNNSIKISGWGAGSWSNFALTPSSVTLKVTSGTTGGTGTQNDPYLVEVGAQFTLSASNLTFSPADPVMVGRYNFGTSTTSTPTGTSTTSTQTASTTANTTKQYYVSVRGYYNEVYSSSYKTASVYVKTVASCTPPTLTLNKTSASVNKGETVNLTTLSGATVTSGTIEWSTSETGTPVISEEQKIDATKKYYARAVGDCKSSAQSFIVTALCTKDFYLVGSSTAIFGSEWSAAQAANKMNCDLNTLTKTYTNITVAANTTVEYKYTGANGWSDAEYPTSGNSSFTIPTAGTYNITFTATTDGTKITGTPTVTWVSACTTVNAPNVTSNGPICAGSTATLTLTNRQEGVTYKLNSTTGTTIFTSGNNTYTTPALNANTTYKIYASHASACTNNVEGSVTVTVNAKPKIILTQETETICNGESITLANYIESKTGTVTWYTDQAMTKTAAAKVSPTTNATYYAKAVNSPCAAATAQLTVTVNDKPATPTVTPETIVLTSGSATLTVSNPVSGATYTLYKDGESTGETGTQFTITSQGVYKVLGSNDCGNSSFSAGVLACAKIDAPTFEAKSMTICEGEPFDLPTPNNLKDGEECAWSISGRPTPGHQSGIAKTTTYQAVKSNDIGCKSDVTEFVVNVTPKPTISGATYTQPGKANAIELTLPTGVSAKWSVSPTADLSVNEGNSTMFSAEANGTYTITADNDGCTATHVVTVSDAFYVYMRQPKKGENAYDNFYFPTQNPTQGGDLFYKEYASIPPAEGYTDYNKGGVAHDKIFTDCDGYVWYGFKASDKLIDGTNYFTVHALNEGGYGGYYTHTYLTQPGKMTSDIYYTMNENASGVSQGWYITKVDAPYAGPKVHASGDAKFNANNFADFVSLYVTDCSGKEVIGYQWSYTAPTCTYIGKETVTMSASTSNNIRVREAGDYTCTVTYKDGKKATSPALTVSTGATNTPALAEFSSNLPIIMVNTNGVGFPDCTGLSGQTASKNASTLKEKRSVDVIIKDGNNIIYDRKARMNYRGSSSLNFVKKSYAFCPGEADCVEDKGRQDYVKTAKLNMLGLGEAYDKDWVLYAAAADPSLMRNRLVFDSYAAMTGEWGVQSRYVELIVDGVYKGVYVFMDKITMNKKRVKVDEKTGFIVKFDKTDKEDRIGGYQGEIGDEKTFATDLTGRKDISTYDTSVDQLFEIEYPEKDDYPTGWGNRTTAIKNMFNNFETALKEGDFSTVQQYIDYTSWADWFIINEYTKNVDAYRASCIFVYTGEAGAKIEARPLWDQELSFNNTATTVGNGKGCSSTADLLINNDGVYTDDFPAPFWFTGNYSTSNGEFTKDKYKGLLDDPCFVQVVKERWETHKAGALSYNSLSTLISNYNNELTNNDADTSAKTRETAFWNGKSRGTCDCSYDTNNTTATGYSNVAMDTSKGTMDTWVLDAQRRAGLSTAISGLTGTTMNIQIIPSTQNITPWEAATITINKSEGYDYTLENDLEAVSGVVVQKNGQSITYRIPRPASWGTGDGNDGREDVTYTITATLNVADGTMVCGSTAAPSSTATIILQDEEDEKCPQ